MPPNNSSRLARLAFNLLFNELCRYAPGQISITLGVQIAKEISPWSLLACKMKRTGEAYAAGFRPSKARSAVSATSLG